MKKVTQDDIRKKSIKESVMMLPLLAKECLSFFPESIKKIFKKKESEVKEAEEQFL